MAKAISSSSDSDIETYFIPKTQIDLDSTFFKPQRNDQLDTESAPQSNFDDEQNVTTFYDFSNFHEYTQHMKEIQRKASEYKSAEDVYFADLDSSDFDSVSDSENWVPIEEQLEEPKKDIEIIVEVPTKEKKKVDMAAVIKRRINRIRKETQILVHKVHLLAWIAHGNYVNEIINKPKILALALSMGPPELCSPTTSTDLQTILKWFRQNFKVVDKHRLPIMLFKMSLAAEIIMQEASNTNMLVYIFCAMVRAMGLQCRLVFNFQTQPLRPPDNELISMKQTDKTKTTEETNKTEQKKPKSRRSLKKANDVALTSSTDVALEENARPKRKIKQKLSPKPKLLIDQENLETSTEIQKPKKKRVSFKIEPEVFEPTDENQKLSPTSGPQNNNNDKKTSPQIENPKSIMRRRLASNIEESLPKVEVPRRRISSCIEIANTKNDAPKPRRLSFSVNSPRRNIGTLLFKVSPRSKIRSLVQLDGQCDEKIGTTNLWVEIFLETKEKWVSVDVINETVDSLPELIEQVSQPIRYVVAWNNDNTLKDVTKRYCPKFNTVTRKLRVDTKWWTTTLKPFVSTKNESEKKEDEELDRHHLSKPLPTVISEYKNHPLYVLKRHLLKFEALYPADSPVLGFIRKEAVYSRECVHILHSRDMWLKQAKVVKLGEKPYKIVKARPKWDKLSNTVITDQMLEVFGLWQTQDYEPPTAENGIVPRNAFGNVELFKECMLPKGTVHLQLPGLSKIARRLNIDCAPALIGFDFHGGWNHPIYDGFIVCEEFADQLAFAWELEEEELDRKEEERIEKRVYGNWKRLIRGLLIREHLKAKYQFEDCKKNMKKKKKSK